MANQNSILKLKGAAVEQSIIILLRLFICAWSRRFSEFSSV